MTFLRYEQKGAIALVQIANLSDDGMTVGSNLSGVTLAPHETTQMRISVGASKVLVCYHD